ncbi:MAG: ion transporter [Lachnospiraceae bacterium]|nr:ion transporter [Lachnospiraceae bacterium]
MKTEADEVKINKGKDKIFRMISVGVVDEPLNQAYDIISTLALILNLTAAVLNTYDNMAALFGNAFVIIDSVTVAFFAVDYILRIITSDCLFPNLTKSRAVLKYITSFTGIIDLLSFLPHYLPFFFPGGTAVFRMFRVVRILRLFRINAYYDSLHVITEVISGKKQQLLSSVFIIVVLMVASSLCMYSVEHEAQPDVFENAFSGIWWSASTLLTVGYGDIYPVTSLGKFLGIVISFLGVGMVAIPTGIISAGFVEQYHKLKSMGDESEIGLHFIRVAVKPQDEWCGKQIKDLMLPSGIIIAIVLRGDRTIVPRGDLKIRADDIVVLGAESMKDENLIDMKEIIINRNHPWLGKEIRDLDISRQSFIFMVKRRGEAIIPRGSLVLLQDDMVFIYSKLSRESLDAGY